jgi:hypothetical protein
MGFEPEVNINFHGRGGAFAGLTGAAFTMDKTAARALNLCSTAFSKRSE